MVFISFISRKKREKLPFCQNTHLSLQPLDESCDISTLVRKKEKKMKMPL